MNEYIRKMTVTTLFILNLVKINRAEIIENGFENAFIRDRIKEGEGTSYDNGVYLLFRPFKVESFNDFVNKQRKNNPNFVDEYDYQNGWTVLVYSYDEKWDNDISLLMQGKFSKTSSQFQAEIPEIITTKKGFRGNVKRELSIQHHIFRRTDTLKRYWATELSIELDDKDDTEYWQYYEEREILTQELLESLDEEYKKKNP